MNLKVQNGKYYCDHIECPYKMCPWRNKGVLVDKNDWSSWHKYRNDRGLWMLPADSLDADMCLAYMDI